MDLQDKSPLQIAISYREWLTGLIVSGVVANEGFKAKLIISPDEIADISVKLADSIIERLQNDPNPN